MGMGDSDAIKPGPSKPEHLKLVDQISAAYNVLLAVVWATLIPQWPYAWALFLTHGAAALLPRLIERAGDGLTPVGRLLRDIYPLLWILAFWTELDFIRRLLHDAAYDRVIGGLDAALFGVHLDEVWMPAMPWVWFSEIMHLAYFGYYLTVILPLLYMLFKGSREMRHDMTLRVVLVYFACYVVYIAFPVDGPHFLSEHYQGPHQQGLFYRLERVLQGQGDSLGCAFPSSHVAASTTMAYLGVRWFSRPVAVLLVVAAAGVAVSTVYTQNHFAIDSVAGILFALWINVLVVPVLMRWWRSEYPLSDIQ
ncbi:MAG: phosphatase PAP2 family protein [Gemmatimonadetes bacterium]|nr:phosphatase PAP2 family protein [Gemmatimonadota bacterium]NIO32431.1 phosphatase PAP2 family protein [Gemmatimonadota bacterium]